MNFLDLLQLKQSYFVILIVSLHLVHHNQEPLHDWDYKAP